MAKLFVLIVMYHQFSAGDIPIPVLPDIPVQEIGVASWYGSGVSNDFGMHGKVTATGEPFNPSLRSCASRSIRLHTVVIVELLRTGKRITCRVNDRGPYGAIHNGEWLVKLSRGDPGEWRGVMDLSRKAAEDIGFNFSKGMEPIAIYYRK